MSFLRTRVVDKQEWRIAHRKTGSVYFLRDAARDAIKIGHSRELEKRIQTLQVGNSGSLKLIGAIAAARAIEQLIHAQLCEAHVQGEWFGDRGFTSGWLTNMTGGEPLYRNVWDLVEGRKFLYDWHPETQSHTKHYWNVDLKQWEPRLDDRP